MAPARSNQLDELERAIGRLEGKLDGIDRYTHEREHGINNVSQKLDALAVKLGADIAAVEARMDSRLKALELNQNSVSTAKQIGVWMIQTAIAVVAAVAAALGIVRLR